MSGTSLDGVDAALVEFLPAHAGIQTLETLFVPFDPDFRARLMGLQGSGEDELHRAGIVSNDIAKIYASAVTQLLDRAGTNPAEVVALGAHGQTVRHRPDMGYTTQLVNPALLAELTGITTIAEFRIRDIAAGGQGAPLVPAFHHAVFRSSTQDRVVVNIGGIANITHLPMSGAVTGFDTGPGNCLMDFWADRHLGQAYDKGGAWAASGSVNPALLSRLLDEPYFSAAPPKSTGRDLFNGNWLHCWLDPIAPEDVQATLGALTAHSIVNAIVTTVRGKRPDIFVCGGGAHNEFLMAMLRQLGPNFAWQLTDALGIPADWVEAVAFAWLARQFLEAEPANLPEVTGARGARILGAMYPA